MSGIDRTPPPAASVEGGAVLENDLVLPFQIENQATRGKLVRLGATVDEIVSRQDYPAPVAMLLGELAVLAALVSSALKYDGILTAQIKGDGAVRMLVADATSEGAIRAYAQYDDEAIERTVSGEGAEDWREAPVPKLIGSGYLALTIDRGPDFERYQGIVELRGKSLAECAHRHFHESDQSQTAFKLAVEANEDGGWKAGGLMIQRLPDSGRALVSGEAPDEDTEDSWRRATILMGSCTEAELVDDALHPHTLLYRLFHEDGVRVFDPQPLGHRCRCSREKVEVTLHSFPREEIDELKIDDMVVVTCEFCGSRYDFDDEDLDKLFRVN